MQMLIGILRGKFVAILLGPAGLGVSSLLNSTINIINQATNLGLGLGGVRELSVVGKQGDIRRLAVVARVLRRLVFWTGVLGAMVSIGGARWWSKLTFGDYGYTWAFVILGAMSFFTALATGETTLLQGTRRLKALARTSLIGSVVGLLIGVPLYWMWGTAGIAPAMVLGALTAYVSNRYFTRKIELPVVEVADDQARQCARTMILLGVTLTGTTVLGTLTVYFINWFIRFNGGLADVGFYQAATSITTQYSGMIFSAMAVDYFPRLAAVSDDAAAVRRAVNQQGEMVLLIVAPIIVAVLAFAPLVIRVLLSEEFMSIVPVVRWMSMALFFKSASYALGYIAFAKGDKKLFFWLEGVWGNVLNVGLSAWCYMLWGINGLGVAMLAAFAIYMIVISVVARRRYGFRFEGDYTRLFAILLGLCAVAFGVTLLVDNYTWCGAAVGVVLVATCIVSWRGLNRRMDIKKLIAEKLGR